MRQLESQPTPIVIEATVEELALAFESAEDGARSEYSGRILKITGLVNQIVVRDDFDNPYIILRGKNNSAQIVRCVFDKMQSDSMKTLIKGKEIVVQGEFTGSRVQLSMRQCIIVR